MHSIDELFVVAVDGDSDDRWAALQALRAHEAAEVFDRAAALCRAPDGRSRSAGAEILGQLAHFRDSAIALLEELTADSEPDVVAAAVLALGQQRDSLDPIVGLAAHPDGKVRWALVTALESSVGDERAEKVLLRLMSDDDADVRDRATFAIGSLSETDSPRIRSALAERLRDESSSVAREAALGLARRRDARAILYIAKAVEGKDQDIEEAVDEITSPEMLAELMKAQRDPAAPRAVDSLVAMCRARL